MEAFKWLNVYIWFQKRPEHCTLKTEQCIKCDEKQGNREVFQRWSGRKLWIFNCGTLLLKKRVTITILRKRICDCLHNSTIREPKISLKGQAIKSARGMPWHQEPMKDVTSCDKLRGGANILWSGDFRMGKPGRAILCQRALNKIGVRGEPSELKHLSRTRKRHQPRFR